MELINRLTALMERADHRPGQWHCCTEEPGRICVLPTDMHSPAPSSFMESLRSFGKGHEGIAREFSKRDMQMVVAVINALPELLSLAEDGQRYRQNGK